MGDFRTEKTNQIYQEFRENGGLNNGCNLCKREEIFAEFEHWKIIPNRFPYDLVASTHHMIIPRRHIVEGELKSDELRELSQIKYTYLNDKYDFILEPTVGKKSIPQHFHLHLIVVREGIQ